MAYEGEPGRARRTRPVRALAAGAFLGLPVVCGPLLAAAPADAAAPPERRIRDIQGAGHVSPLNGRAVARVPGVVTAVAATGFWMQDPRPDRKDATSEGVYVFTRERPTVAAGDSVRVDGRVTEYRPGGVRSAALGRTEIDATRTAVEARGVPLPAPVLIGSGGRRVPGTIMTGPTWGAARDIERGGRFDPRRNALDFYETIEGMRAGVRNAVAAGPSRYGEAPVLPAGAARTPRGALDTAADANPERVVLDDTLAPLPRMNAGDRLPGVAAGVLDSAYGAFKLLVTAAPRHQDGGAKPEETRAARPGELAVATADLGGLSPDAPRARIAALAADIVSGLKSPDLVTVTGLRDNSGTRDDGTVAADQTVAELITAISAAGGPGYDWRSVPPRDNADGGEKGSNDHVGFLFRSDRGLSFVDRPTGGDEAVPETAPVKAVRERSGVRLSLSPGRVAPGDAAWSRTRKPVAGEVTWKGNRIIVVANQWYPRSGDDHPAFGRYQPPTRPTEWRRMEQAKVIARFVRSVRAADRNADIIVAGDLGEPEHATPVRALAKETGLRDLPAALPAKDRYTTVTQGSARATDHIMVSPSLAARKHEYDIVHRNADFASRAGGHDPAVLRIDMSGARTRR
ncbi:endonuclease/exonuclease/phosphatase [Spirillospora sp. NPDC029432]|uniref:endonuclease/exonuclease/phosphatase n=1 Tax=Spirillospora sp. NPDC029432 TaxID=3154599 RepID=UPI0034544858